jgi:hypothetical protein
MKLQLDTENKTITIEEDVNLHEFYEQINSILPGGLRKLGSGIIL